MDKFVKRRKKEEDQYNVVDNAWVILYYAIRRNVNVHYIFVVVNVISYENPSLGAYELEVIKGRHNYWHMSDLTYIPLLKTVGSIYNIKTDLSESGQDRHIVGLRNTSVTATSIVILAYYSN